MDLRIARDVFRRRGLQRSRVGTDALLGADAYVSLPPAFVTGLRDWRRADETSARQPADAVDGEWHPL